MKVVQFFKIYNFYVVQICARSKDLKIFSKVQMNSNLIKEKHYLVANYNKFRTKMQ